MKRLWLAAAAVAALTACQQRPVENGRAAGSSFNEVSAPPADRAASRSAASTSAADPLSPELDREPAAPDVPALAYRYDYAVEAPQDRVAALMRRHERACVAAGPTVCQVLSQNASTDADSGRVAGELVLRAVPRWVEDFRERLGDEVRGADGRVLNSGTATDDLTRELGDRQADVAAAMAERDRLRALLRDFFGSAEERQDLERQADALDARLNDSSRDLRASEAQVTMSVVRVGYRSPEGWVSSEALAPLGWALRNVVAIVSAILAAVITLGAVLLVPGVIGGGLWAALRGRRRRTASPPLSRPAG